LWGEGKLRNFGLPKFDLALKVPDHKGVGFTIGDALLRQTPAALHIERFRIPRIKMNPGHAMLTGLIFNGRHEPSRHAALAKFRSHVEARQPGLNIMKGFELLQNQQANAGETAVDRSDQYRLIFIGLGGKFVSCAPLSKSE